MSTSSYGYGVSSGGGGSLNPRLVNSTAAGVNVHGTSSFHSIQHGQQSLGVNGSNPNIPNGVTNPSNVGGSMQLSSGLLLGAPSSNNSSLLTLSAHNQARPHQRKYDSEPLHRSSSGNTRGLDAYQASGHSTILSSSFVSTANTSASSSRAQSRAATANSSHIPSPRSLSPQMGMSANTSSSLLNVTPSQSQSVNGLNSSNISPTLANSQLGRPLLHTPLMVTPPSSTATPLSTASGTPSQSTCRCGVTGAHTHTSPSQATSPSPLTPCCPNCADLRQENGVLRGLIATNTYELQALRNSTKLELTRLRSDVTKALVAFESRLHLQLQQQIGFQPNLEPVNVANATSASVNQALSQIQQQLDKFERTNEVTSGNGNNSPWLNNHKRAHGSNSWVGNQPSNNAGGNFNSNPSASPVNWSSQDGSNVTPAGSPNPGNQSSNNSQQFNVTLNNNAAANPPQLTSGLLNSSHHGLLAPSVLLSSNNNQSNNNSLSINTNTAGGQTNMASVSPTNLLANINLNNINLANLSHLLNAVNGLQNQLNNGSGNGGVNVNVASNPHLTNLLLNAANSNQSLNVNVNNAMSMMNNNNHHHNNANHHSGHSNMNQGGSITEERLILLAIDILANHGAVPVGKMGSLLHKAANDHTLPQMLKERYGGLKKWLQSMSFNYEGKQVPFFTLGVDHPYNPQLSFSTEFLAANPHIRPPEPQPLPSPSTEAALPSILGAEANYQAFYSQTQQAAAANNSSLLTPLTTSSANLHRDYSMGSAGGSMLSGSGSASTLSISGGESTNSLSSAANMLDMGDNLMSHEWQFEADELERVTSFLNAKADFKDKEHHTEISGEHAVPFTSAEGAVNNAVPASTTTAAGDAVVGSTTTADGWPDKVTVTAAANAADAPASELPNITHSPSLGASDSATANATFFSRLLG